MEEGAVHVALYAVCISFCLSHFTMMDDGWMDDGLSTWRGWLLFVVWYVYLYRWQQHVTCCSYKGTFVRTRTYSTTGKQMQTDPRSNNRMWKKRVNRKTFSSFFLHHWKCDRFWFNMLGTSYTTVLPKQGAPGSCCCVSKRFRIPPSTCITRPTLERSRTHPTRPIAVIIGAATQYYHVPEYYRQYPRPTSSTSDDPKMKKIQKYVHRALQVAGGMRSCKPEHHGKNHHRTEQKKEQ